MSGENPDPRVESGIGRSLETARKSRGLSLRQVEQETRIRSRYLHDLERENFDVLPAVYVLGSLKTYADFLGLDGAALSRQLKASLVEPDEPDQLAAPGDARDGDDEYEAAPVPAVGFDQLFLGMGVILVSILAVMTIVTAVAQGDESPISQINQPSTPEAPSEIALAGNVEDGDGVQSAGDGDPAEDGDKGDKPDKSEAPKDDGDGEESKDEGEDDQDVSQSASLFGDVEFVPMPPSFSPTPAASASASSTPASSTTASPTTASPTAASSTTASPTAASSTTASPSPTTVESDDSRASTAPAATPPASTEASPEPARDAPDPVPSAPVAASGGASSAPAPSGGVSPRPGGGEGGQTAPAGEANSDLISAEADRKVNEAFEAAGIVR